jgi:hypothetical protein
MSDAFTVRPLRCDHCGSELPVMGQFVTFQCQTCFHYWVISPEGLKPIHVYRAIPKKEPEGETIHLPFWVIELDCPNLRTQVTTTVTELHEKTKVIAGTQVELEKDNELESLVRENFGYDISMRAVKFVQEASKSVSVPTSAEVDYMLRRIESRGKYYLYVPSFKSVNTYAYLKIGRLMTKRQPGYRVEKSSGVARSILCALQADEALSLMDFVFFATLPESIQMSSDFLERIRLKPVGRPHLVEFPFEQKGSSFSSLIADFQISGRLIELQDVTQSS